MICVDAAFYDFLEFRLEEYSGKSYEERSTHESINDGNYFTSMSERSHISISDGRHRYRGKIEWAEHTPSFYKMETDSSYDYDNTDNKCKKQDRMIRYKMGEKFFDKVHTLYINDKYIIIVYRIRKNANISKGYRKSSV